MQEIQCLSDEFEQNEIYYYMNAFYNVVHDWVVEICNLKRITDGAQFQESLMTSMKSRLNVISDMTIDYVFEIPAIQDCDKQQEIQETQKHHDRDNNVHRKNLTNTPVREYNQSKRQKRRHRGSRGGRRNKKPKFQNSFDKSRKTYKEPIVTFRHDEQSFDY